MHSAVAVANTFIARGLEQRAPDLSPTMVHELVYLAHGWHLGQTGQPLISSAIAAFRDGVMIPELREKGFWGTRRVEEMLSVLDPTESSVTIMQSQVPEVTKDDPAMTIIEWIWNTYGALTPFQLNNLAREPGSPWDKVWNHPQRTREEPYDIPQPLIEKWFSAEVKIQRQRRRGAENLKHARDANSENSRTQAVIRVPKNEDLRSA